MNKAQRKRRAQEMKRKAKLAKRAKREADNSQDVREPEAADTGAVAATSEAPKDAGETPAPGAGKDACATAPTQDEIHMAHAKMNWAEADAIEAEISAKMGDDEAVELLTKAARALGEVVDYVSDLLKRLPKDQMAEAIRIQNRPRTYGDKSRNGANPVVQLMNILVRAENLMIRLVKQTNPELAKRMKAAKAK